MDEWVNLHKRLRPVVIARAMSRCQIRGPHCICPGWLPERDLEVDHIIPRSHGGAIADLRNLRAVCKPCHVRKTALERGYNSPGERRRTKPPIPTEMDLTNATA